MSDKLVRAFDTLTNAPKESGGSSLPGQSGISERLNACRVVVEFVCGEENKKNKDFQKFFAVSISALLRAHDDVDSSVRILAQECLNTIVKVLILVLFIYFT